jgi:hypothetical protein
MRKVKTITAERTACPINKAVCRRLLMSHAADSKYHKFSQVSSVTMDRLVGVVRREIKAIVAAAPSRGKTL